MVVAIHGIFVLIWALLLHARFTRCHNIVQQERLGGAARKCIALMDVIRIHGDLCLL